MLSCISESSSLRRKNKPPCLSSGFEIEPRSRWKYYSLRSRQGCSTVVQVRILKEWVEDNLLKVQFKEETTEKGL